MAEKIRWGILGPGRIAHNFVKDLALVPQAELKAVASRDLGRARVFAQEFGFSRAYGSYLELLEDKEVDVVYIATPHTGHAALSILAMDHGKHVLCEKPMGMDAAEVSEMIAASHRNNVFLMEALWSRFNPAIQEVKALVVQGEVGPLAYLRADFAFNAMDRDPQGRVLNPALGGGSLLDIGIYPVFLAYLLLGLPNTVLSTSHFHANGAEVQTSIIMTYPKAHAVLYSGFTSASEMKAEISGERGRIYLPGRWHEAQGYSVESHGDEKRFDRPTIGRGYYYEIQEVHHCIGQGKLESGQWSHQNSLDLIGLLDRIREQNDIRFPR